MRVLRVAALTAALFLQGCTALLRPELDANVNYQRDIVFTIRYAQGDKWSQEYTITGMGVVPKADWYKVRVFPPGKADMITLDSCHREIKTPAPDKGWFEKGYEFDFSLVGSLESENSCSIVSIGVYEKKAGRHAWGDFAIVSDREKLPALTKCNGRIKQYGGVSVCQAKEGLIQEYIFDRPVDVAYTYGCEIKKPADGKVWQFLMPAGECKIYFIDIKNPDIIHLAHMFGYNTIPIRGVE